MEKKILVVGGAGYIGSHAVLLLNKAGYEAHILDDFSHGHKDFIGENTFFEGSLGDTALLDSIFSKNKYSAIFHFAAFTYVGESVTDPAKYYQNNVSATLNLLEKMIEYKINNFIFSSTCATYGEPKKIPLVEDHSQNPINPYGWSKFMVERIIEDFHSAYNLNAVIFRYFNAAGADIETRRGERHDPETHLIPVILEAAAGKRDEVKIFGNDYETRDGTCIRDYIHVSDLAQAHLLGMNKLWKDKGLHKYNLGNGQGFTVKEIIESCSKVSGKQVKYQEVARREGDPPALIGDASKAFQELNWKPEFTKLEDIIQTAWNWHKKDWNN